MSGSRIGLDSGLVWAGNSVVYLRLFSGFGLEVTIGLEKLHDWAIFWTSLGWKIDMIGLFLFYIGLEKLHKWDNAVLCWAGKILLGYFMSIGL